MNVITLPKATQTFLFVYDDEPESRNALLVTLGRFAAAPDLAEFTWGDAAMIAQWVREKGKA